MATDSKTMGAVGGKNRKVHGDEDARMTTGDLEQLASLLAKATENKDDRALKLVEFVKQAAGLKEDVEIERKGVVSQGSMTDASKRRLEDWSTVDTFDVAGSALEMMQEYERVEMEIEEFQRNRSNVGSGGYPAIGKPGGVIAENFGGYNKGIPLPRSVKDVEEWGSTLITLPAKKHLQLSYLEFVKLTRTCAENRQYAKFLVGKFSEKAVEQLVEHGECKSQGFDLAAYLLHVCYDRCEMEKPVPTFSRKLK